MKDNFCYLERDKFYFDKILKEAISDEMKAFILYKNKMASAYIIFGLYEENIEIRECLALDNISYKEILALIYGYRDYYRNVSLASSNNSNLEFLFENQLNIEKIVKPFMMMRVLNPLAIFKNLKLEKFKEKYNFISSNDDGKLKNGIEEDIKEGIEWALDESKLLK